MSELTVLCPYCDPAKLLLHSTPGKTQDLQDWRRAWKSTALIIECPSCASESLIVDDDTPASSGGFVKVVNVSRPRIDLVTIATGDRRGGESIYIKGSGLDVGNLEVRFGGKLARAVTNRASTQARIVTPTARYTLCGAVPLVKFNLSNVTGTFEPGDVVSVANGTEAIVRRAVSAGIYWLQMTLVGDIDSLIREKITGPHGSGSVLSVAEVSLSVGEEVKGLTSGALAVVGRALHPIAIDSPSRAFVGSELVVGLSSGAHVLLADIPYSGQVDVTVENEYGQRNEGGRLVGAFTYL